MPVYSRIWSRLSWELSASIEPSATVPSGVLVGGIDALGPMSTLTALQLMHIEALITVRTISFEELVELCGLKELR